MVSRKMRDAPVKKLVIHSRVSEAHQAQQTIMKEAAAHRFTNDAGFAVRLALDEALSNAIHHGNRDDPHKHITLDYQITDERVRICVCDEGAGFNPDAVPDPTLDENLQRPHGRGIMLMRAYMTQVIFNDRGNCVTLVKRRNCPLPRR